MSYMKGVERMRIFGLEIRRVSKMDHDESVMLAKTISSLHSELNDFIPFMNDLDLENFNNTNAGEIFNRFESIHRLVDLYEENKFSRPGECFSMVYHLGEMEKCIVEFNKDMETFTKGKFIVKNVQSAMNQSNGDFSEEHQELGQMLVNVWSELKLLISRIIAHATIIDICIRGDIIRLGFGVDVVRDYYEQRKRMKQNKGKDLVKYEIGYVHDKSRRSK